MSAAKLGGSFTFPGSALRIKTISLMLIAASFGHAATPPDLGEAKSIIANARKILTPGGIERLESVQIGGIKQWVSIRGVDRRNPVLLVIHGGPGYVDLPTSWWFGRGWEEYFTVVYWDQRAAGKTHLLNDPATIKPSLTIERMVADAEEMVTWLRRDLGKDKIFVLGHSWGSYPGILIAEHHPEWLHAYIGVGQLSNGPEGERRSWTDTLVLARKVGDAQAVHELESLVPYAADSRPMPIETILAERKWVARLGGTMAYRRDNHADGDLVKLSPDYSEEESRHAWDGNDFATPLLLPQILSTDLGVKQLNVPLLIFAGRHDTNVDSHVVAEWYAKVKAPEKHFVWFEHSAHLPMTEEPAKFLVSLVLYARPVAERAGDVAPE
jgi:proline iminopeptidase